MPEKMIAIVGLFFFGNSDTPLSVYILDPTMRHRQAD